MAKMVRFCFTCLAEQRFQCSSRQRAQQIPVAGRYGGSRGNFGREGLAGRCWQEPAKIAKAAAFASVLEHRWIPSRRVSRRRR